MKIPYIWSDCGSSGAGGSMGNTMSDENGTAWACDPGVGDDFEPVCECTTSACCGAQEIRYIDSAADSGGDGLTWETAWNDISKISDVTRGYIYIRGSFSVSTSIYGKDCCNYIGVDSPSISVSGASTVLYFYGASGTVISGISFSGAHGKGEK